MRALANNFGLSVPQQRSRACKFLPKAKDSSAQHANLPLEHGPCVRPVFLLPFVIKAGRAKRPAKFLRIGRVEDHTLLHEIVAQGFIELADVPALRERGLVDMAGNDVLQDAGQGGPCSAIRERPRTRPTCDW